MKSSKIRNLFDATDLQKILGLSYISVCRMLRAKTIKAQKIGQKWYVHKKDMDNYLNKGNIFDKPEKVILDCINGALAEAQAENIARLELAVKQKIASEMESNIKKNLAKADQNNIRLTEFVSKEVSKQLEKRTELIKKELAKI